MRGREGAFKIMEQEVFLPFARTNGTIVSFRPSELRRHLYICGASGTGKTTLLKNLTVSLLRNNFGVGVLDPHGDLVQDLLSYIPRRRTNQVLLFNPLDISRPIGLNVLENLKEEHKYLVVDNLVTIFKNLFGSEFWGPRSGYIFTNALWVLLSQPRPLSLAFLPKLLLDHSFRNRLMKRVKDPLVLRFFEQEYNRYKEDYRQEVIAPLLNKVGALLLNPLIRNIIGQTRSTFDFRKLMDEGGIFFANLDKGQLGSEASKLLGSLLITKIQLAAMSRSELPEEKRRDFFLFVDEVQGFITESSFEAILSEARKYHLALIMANQFLEQLPPSVLASIFGNVGNLVVFRVSARDGQYLEKEFQFLVKAEELQTLPDFTVYIKKSSQIGRYPLTTLPPFPKVGTEQNPEVVLKVSRLRHGRSRRRVERWLRRKLR
ncbi:AAA-like domain-containing protein [Candidatus Fervidibacteria bacterium JGI MDM2 JNZ-1-D12]